MAKYGKLMFVEVASEVQARGTHWRMRCDCGNEKIARRDHIVSGRTRSCGCLAMKNALRHGDTGTRLHNIWRGMLRRCDAKVGTAYEKYAARGIDVCEDWRTYEAFKDWAIANGYNDNLTIDRVNNDGDYEPSNCHWISAKRQARNRRSSRLETIAGVTKTLAEWCDDYSADYSRTLARLRLGWPIEDALTKPKGARLQ